MDTQWQIKHALAKHYVHCQAACVHLTAHNT